MKVLLPAGFDAERRYALAALLDDLADLEVETVADLADVEFHALGRCLRVNDVYFRQAALGWQTVDSLITVPLPMWDAAADGLAGAIREVPIIFGRPAVTRTCENIKLHADLFGAAFHLLSRHEEVFSRVRDEHDRFPATASLAYRAGFLDRPLVDEYAVLLRTAMRALWPTLPLRTAQFHVRLGHDVDRPYRYAHMSLGRLILAMGADVINRQAPILALKRPGKWLTVRAGWEGHDPFFQFDWMMSVSEAHGIRSTFYFICGQTRAQFDADYDIAEPRMRRLLRNIHRRGHEIGLHPSYNCYRDSQAIKREFTRLRQVCSEEGIEQQSWGARMHYLRFDAGSTPRLLDDAGLDNDATLSFADRAGFRCGTCRSFQLWDWGAGRPLRIREQPLIAMECSLLAPAYEGLAYAAAEVKLQLLAERCREVGGEFSLLWHNSELATEMDRDSYRRVIETLPPFTPMYPSTP